MSYPPFKLTYLVFIDLISPGKLLGKSSFILCN